VGGVVGVVVVGVVVVFGDVVGSAESEWSMEDSSSATGDVSPKEKDMTSPKEKDMTWCISLSMLLALLLFLVFLLMGVVPGSSCLFTGDVDSRLRKMSLDRGECEPSRFSLNFVRRELFSSRVVSVCDLLGRSMWWSSFS